MPNMDMRGKNVVLTGASRGIGAATARAFAAAGAKVVLLARDSDAIAALAGEIGDRALAIPCDVSRAWEVDQAIAAAQSEFGPIDVLIANAGVIGPIGPLGLADPEEWSRTIDINLKGVFNCMRSVLPAMSERKAGTFITVSSGAAHSPVTGWSAYCASKAGAFMLTRQAHTEYAGSGVRVLGLSPGTVATDMQRAIKASGVGPVAQLDWSAHIAPEWPAQALIWMCGPGADAYLGSDISLRDDAIRRAVGLVS